MNKKITAFIIIASVLLLVFAACTDMDPLGIANGVPEGYEVVQDNDWIYFAEGNNIKKMRLDGSEVEPVLDVTGLAAYEHIKKIQLNPLRRKIYILTEDNNMFWEERILSYDLDEVEDPPVTLVSQGDKTDMTLDHVNQYLYYTTTTNGDGLNRINLETSNIEDVFNVDFGSSAFVTPDFKGGVYYLHEAVIAKVLNTTTNSPLVSPVPAPTNNSMGLCYNSTEDFLYFYDIARIRKIEIANPGAGYPDVFNNVESITGNLVIFQTENKIFFSSSNAGPPITYSIYSIKMDGTGGKNAIYTNNFGISTFDILAK